MSSEAGYFERHEDHAFILKAFLTIAIILFIKVFFPNLLSLFIILLPLLLLIYIRIKASSEGISFFRMLVQNIGIIPHAEKDRIEYEIPWCTYFLILTNILIFYLYQLSMGNKEFIVNNLVFLPYQPNQWNITVSAFTSMFLHDPTHYFLAWILKFRIHSHLFYNMLFLWIFGTAVERRIGSLRFTLIYLITGLFGGITYILATLFATGEPGHLLGASGAIAGIMGVFAIRCYFKSLVIPIPILGPIGPKIRLNSIVVVGLFFVNDLSGGIEQLSGDSASMVGHWCHLGGMISGMILACLLKLGQGAIEERHLDLGLKASGSNVGYAGAEKSLKLVLEKNSENIEALLGMARIKSKFGGEEGMALYTRLLGILVTKNPTLAVTAYDEYRRAYLKPLPATTMLALAGIYQRQMDLNTATRCLEAVLADPATAPELRARSLSQCAILLDKMGHEEVACDYFKTLISEFPDSELSERAYTKLGLQRPTRGQASQAAQASQTCQTTPTGHNPHPAVDAATTDPTCPLCNAEMLKRQSNKGAQAGKLFWVCADFPNCQSVIPVAEAQD